VTLEGLRQAKEVARLVADESRPDALFTSPLGRAVTTARFIEEVTGLAPFVVPGLSEMNMGLLTGLTDIEVETRFPGMMEGRSHQKWDWTFPGGESYASAAERAASVISLVRDSGADCVVVVSHEMFERVLVFHLLGLDRESAMGHRHPHGVVYEIDTETPSMRELRHA